MADAGFSAFVESVSFVRDVLDIWDKIETQMHEEAKTTHLAQQLHDFGLQDIRDDVKINLETMQKLLRDRTLDPDRKKRLLREFGGFYTLLKELQDAVDNVLKDTSKPRTEAQVRPKLRWSHILGALMPNRTRIHSPSAQQILDAKLTDLQKAMGTFNTLVMRLGPLTQSGQLAEPFRLAAAELQYTGGMKPMDNGLTFLASASYVAPGEKDAVEKDVIVESLPFKQATMHAVEEGVRNLAARLRPALASSFIPCLLGYRLGEEAVELVFERPLPGREVVSLAKLYATGSPVPSLNVRVALCRQLAVAVLQTHALGLVHKGIRPENLLIAVQREDERAIITDATLFLCGWDSSRLIEGVATKRVGASTPEKLMYQHPERHADGGTAPKKYEIKHDIYSLGVCAVEILTWEVLIQPDTTLSTAYRTAYDRIEQSDANRHGNDGNSNENDDDDDNDYSAVHLTEQMKKLRVAIQYTNNGTHVQDTLVAVAKQKLPVVAGDRMAQLVRQCLDPQSIVQGEDRAQISDNIADSILDDLDKISSAI